VFIYELISKTLQAIREQARKAKSPKVASSLSCQTVNLRPPFQPAKEPFHTASNLPTFGSKESNTPCRVSFLLCGFLGRPTRIPRCRNPPESPVYHTPHPYRLPRPRLHLLLLESKSFQHLPKLATIMRIPRTHGYTKRKPFPVHQSVPFGPFPPSMPIDPGSSSLGLGQ